jgi:competence protein ComEA
MDVDVRRRVSDLLDSLADRLGISVWGVIVGAVAVGVAGLAGWWAFRAPDPPPVEDVLPRVDAVDAAVSVVAAPSASIDLPVPTTIVVHIDGAVARPGVHELDDGARVVDAVEAAGGLLAEADRERLNLAAPISDGQRLWVPWVGEEEPAVVSLSGGEAPSSDRPSTGPIDLNTADQAALETLPGVGPSIAGAILRHREQEGPFERVEDLLEVAGIGPSRLAQLEPLVTV